MVLKNSALDTTSTQVEVRHKFYDTVHYIVHDTVLYSCKVYFTECNGLERSQVINGHEGMLMVLERIQLINGLERTQWSWKVSTEKCSCKSPMVLINGLEVK